MEFTSSHKCIKNTSTCGLILTDYLPDTSKSHIQPKLQERLPCTGRAKKKGIGMGHSYTPGRDLWKRKDSLTLGTPFANWEISWAEGEIQRLSGESAAGSELAEQIETSIHGPGHLTAYPSPRAAAAGVPSGNTQTSADRPGYRTKVGYMAATWRG